MEHQTAGTGRYQKQMAETEKRERPDECCTRQKDEEIYKKSERLDRETQQLKETDKIRSHIRTQDNGRYSTTSDGTHQTSTDAAQGCKLSVGWDFFRLFAFVHAPSNAAIVHNTEEGFAKENEVENANGKEWSIAKS